MPRSFGGLYLYGAAGIVIPTANVGTTAGLYSILIDASGIPYWGQTAGGAATTSFIPDSANLTRPYFTYPSDPGQGTIPTSSEFKNMFGTAAGGPGNPFSGVAAGSTTSAGSLQSTTFGQAQVPWGIALVDVFAVYSVQTAALTGATIGVNRVIFSENVAEGVTSVLAATAIATTTTTSATTPHVQKVSLAQPLTFENVDFSSLVVTLSINAAATSVVRVYGIGMHVVVTNS
jgi:hypothetical protein